MTADDLNMNVLGCGSSKTGDEGGSADDIKGGDTEETLGVVDTSLLEGLGDNGDCGVDRVGNNEHHGLGAVFGRSLSELLHDGGVGLVEQIWVSAVGQVMEEVECSR